MAGRPDGGYCPPFQGPAPPQHGPYVLVAEILRGVTILDGAMCREHPGVFDGGNDLLDTVAVDMCESCPCRVQCQDHVDAMSSWQRRQLTGIWAGKMYNGSIPKRRNSEGDSMTQGTTDETVPTAIDFAHLGGWLEALAELDGQHLVNTFNLWLEDGENKLFRILVAATETLVRVFDLRDNPANLALLRADAADYLACSTVPDMSPAIWASLSTAAKAAILELVQQAKDEESQRKGNDND